MRLRHGRRAAFRAPSLAVSARRLSALGSSALVGRVNGGGTTVQLPRRPSRARHAARRSARWRGKPTTIAKRRHFSARSAFSRRQRPRSSAGRQAPERRARVHVSTLKAPRSAARQRRDQHTHVIYSHIRNMTIALYSATCVVVVALGWPSCSKSDRSRTEARRAASTTHPGAEGEADSLGRAGGSWMATSEVEMARDMR